MRKIAARKSGIPRELRGKISPLIVGVIRIKRFMVPFGIALTIFSLYGPVIRHRDHNAIRYLLGPFVVSSVAGLYFTVFPFRSYLGNVYVERSGKVDTSDPVVMDLVEIYKSAAARRFLWLAAMKLSASEGARPSAFPRLNVTEEQISRRAGLFEISSSQNPRPLSHRPRKKDGAPGGVLLSS
jgi:hypothetical protein